MLPLLLALCLPASAKTFAGVTLPDTATLGGQTVTLNGMGLREKFFVDVYVGGLYLAHPTHDAAQAIAADEPKRVVMHFVYGSVTREQIVETFHEGFGGAPGVAAQQANIDKVISWVPATVVRGEEMAFDYVPGVGTTLLVKGKAVGTIPGADFMKLVFGIYLGPKPPTEDLKRGLLGT
jgi:hypothetical protein